MVDVLARVLVPAMARVGDAWEAGELSIAEEHRASEIAERLLAGIDHRRPGRPRGRSTTTCPSTRWPPSPTSTDPTSWCSP